MKYWQTIDSLMQEMQENYYLVLFMFASQLYFCNKAIKVS